jgi:hypothetical protein
MNMAGHELVLCDVLCFLFTKFGKHPLNIIKRILGDFFSTEALRGAKSQLLEDASLLDIPESLPRVSIRHVGDDSSARHVDDILKIVEFLDEKKVFDQLPRYVTDNTDRMPMSNLAEGDLKFFLDKIDKIEQAQAGLKMGTVEAIAADVRDLKQLYSDLLPAIHQSLFTSHLSTYRAVNTSRKAAGPSSAAAFFVRPGTQSSESSGLTTGNSTTVFTTNTVPSATGILNTNVTTAAAPVVLESAVRRPIDVGETVVAGASWAEKVTSTPSTNRYDILQSMNDDNDGDGPYTLVESNRTRRERQRQQRDLFKRPLPRSPNELPLQQQQQQRRSRSQLLIGKGRIQGAQLSAAKKLFKKAVLYIDNLKPLTTADSLKLFVENNLGVHVVSCFPVNPRRLRGDDDDPEVRKTTRSAFRLCVKEDDMERLLVDSRWPDSIIISKWMFSKKESSGDKRRKVGDQAMDGQSMDVVRSESLSSNPVGGDNGRHDGRRDDSASSSTVGDNDPDVSLAVTDTSVKEMDTTILVGTAGYLSAGDFFTN